MQNNLILFDGEFDASNQIHTFSLLPFKPIPGVSSITATIYPNYQNFLENMSTHSFWKNKPELARSFGSLPQLSKTRFSQILGHILTDNLLVVYGKADLQALQNTLGWKPSKFLNLEQLIRKFVDAPNYRLSTLYNLVGGETDSSYHNPAIDNNMGKMVLLHLLENYPVTLEEIVENLDYYNSPF